MAEYVKMGEYIYMPNEAEYFQNYTQYSLLMPCKKNELLAPLSNAPCPHPQMEDTDTGFLQFGMCDQISKVCNVGNMHLRIAINAAAATIPMTFQMYMRMGFMRMPRRTMFSCMPKNNTVKLGLSDAMLVDGQNAQPSTHTHRTPPRVPTDHADPHQGFGGAQGNNPGGSDNSSSFLQLGPSGNESTTLRDTAGPDPPRNPLGPDPPRDPLGHDRSAVLGELEDLSHASQNVHHDKPDTDDRSEGDASQSAPNSMKKSRNRLRTIAIPEWAKDTAEGQVPPSATDTV